MNVYIIMKNIATCLLATLMGLDIAYAGISDTCHEEKVGLFKEYHNQLKIPDSNTARYFNMKYIVSQMKHAGIDKTEYRDRLLKYFTSTDYLQLSVSLLSAHAQCMERTARVFFRITNSNPIVSGEFIDVSFVDGKIIGIRFVKHGQLVNKIPIQDLNYKTLE